jgi:hypothetical protein
MTQVTYLDFIVPADSLPRQTGAIFFDLSSVFDFIPHALFRYKLSFGLSAGYVKLIPSYLSKR